MEVIKITTKHTDVCLFVFFIYKMEKSEQICKQKKDKNVGVSLKLCTWSKSTISFPHNNIGNENNTIWKRTSKIHPINISPLSV